MFSSISSFFSRAPKNATAALKERLTSDNTCREFDDLYGYFLMQCPLISLINEGIRDPKTGLTVESMMQTFVEKVTAVASSEVDLTDLQIKRLASLNKDITQFCNKCLDRVSDEDYARKIHLAKDNFNAQMKKILPEALQLAQEDQPEASSLSSPRR